MTPARLPRAILALAGIALCGTLSAAEEVFTFGAPMVTNIEQLPGSYSTGIGAFAAGDLDGNGRAELVMIRHNPNLVEAAELMAFELDARGVLRKRLARPLYDSQGVYLYQQRVLGVGDLDADGLSEIVLLRANPTRLHVFARDAAGAYRLSASTRFPERVDGLNVTTVRIDFADLDADGHVDLVAHENGDEYLVFPGRGDHTFGDPLRAPSYGNMIYGDQHLDDFDGDGLTDLVVSFGYALGAVGLAWGADIPHRFELMRNIPVPSMWPVFATSADLDADGVREVVYAPFHETVDGDVIEKFHVLDVIRVGPGRTLAPPERHVLDMPYVQTSNSAARPVDLDGDGDDELVIRFNGRVDIARWEAGTFAMQALPYPTDANGGALTESRHLAVVDLDGDGCRDVAAANTYSFFYYLGADCGDGTTVLPREVGVPAKPAPPAHDRGRMPRPPAGTARER
jgi:hypothetical protein